MICKTHPETLSLKKAKNISCLLGGKKMIIKGQSLQRLIAAGIFVAIVGVAFFAPEALPGALALI